MIYVGIDIAKKKHFAACMTAGGEVLVPPFSFTNDAGEFNTFLAKIKSFDKSDTLIGLESTARYGENLICFLFDLGYQVSMIRFL